MSRAVKSVVVVLAVLAVLGGLGAVAYYRWEEKLDLASLGRFGGETGEVDAAVPVAVYRARSQRITDSLLLSGEVKARTEVSIFSTVPGKVQEILAREGAPVEKDRVLCYIDRSEAGLTYAPTPVKSTITGVIKEVLVETGAWITPQSPLFQVVDMDTVEVVAHVPERDVGRVTIGLPARLTVIAHPGRVFDGTVSRLSPVVDPVSRTREARVRIPNPGHLLKPGMFGEVRIIIRASTGDLVIPLSAVLEREGRRFVYVVEQGGAARVEPVFGIREADRVAVTSGLEPGAQVIVIGQQNVDNGDPVTVTEEVTDEDL
jgi:multidrug efflux pump subunit AcrA (membrane-fusion protein)